MLGPPLRHHCSASSCSTLPLPNFALVVLALFAPPTPQTLFYSCSLLIPCAWDSVWQVLLFTGRCSLYKCMVKLVNELLKTQSPAFASTVHQTGVKALPLIFVWLILSHHSGLKVTKSLAQ